eukprot:scaffold831_cov336-Prasinococcus_capsulatus_cf.AAC.1
MDGWPASASASASSLSLASSVVACAARRRGAQGAARRSTSRYVRVCLLVGWLVGWCACLRPLSAAARPAAAVGGVGAGRARVACGALDDGPAWARRRGCWRARVALSGPSPQSRSGRTVRSSNRAVPACAVRMPSEA